LIVLEADNMDIHALFPNGCQSSLQALSILLSLDKFNASFLPAAKPEVDR
jgi:hypothetical protein